MSSKNCSGDTLATDAAPTVLHPLCIACGDNTTNSAVYENSTDERLSLLEHAVLSINIQISTLENQQDPMLLLRNDSAAFCSDVEQVCVSVLRARSETSSSNTATTAVPITPSPPKLIWKNFLLQTRVNLADLPDYPVVSDIDLSTLTIARSARGVMFRLSACVTEDNAYTEAEKVSLEALKVSQSAGASQPPKTLGICLGYSLTTGGSVGVGRRSIGAGSTRCICRPDATLLQETANSKGELKVDLTWIGNSLDNKDSLELCVFSTWPHDITRKHAHLGATCTGVLVFYFTS